MEDRHAPHGSACTDVLSVSLIGATGLRDVRPWGKGLNMGESAAPVPATQCRLLSRHALPAAPLRCIASNATQLDSSRCHALCAWSLSAMLERLLCWGCAAKMSPFFVISMGPIRWRSKTDKRARAAAGSACLKKQSCYRGL